MIYSLPVVISSLVYSCPEVLSTAGTFQEAGVYMSSMLVFISSKAFNSLPRQTSPLADLPLYSNKENKNGDQTDSADIECDFDDAVRDFAEVGVRVNA